MHDVKEQESPKNNMPTVRIYHDVNQNQVHLRLLVIQSKMSNRTSHSKLKMPSWLENDLEKGSSNLPFANTQKKIHSFLSEKEPSG